MSRMLLASLCLLLPGTLWAATDLPPPAQAFSAAFTETRTLPGFSQPLVSHGTVVFKRDSGVRWEVSEPYHYLFTMDDKGMQEQLPDGAARTIDAEHAPWLVAIQHIFMGALAGDTAALQEYFDVKVTPQTAGRLIDLTPKPGPMAKAIKHISVSGGATPEDIRIDEIAGGRIDIRFLNPHTQAETP